MDATHRRGTSWRDPARRWASSGCKRRSGSRGQATAAARGIWSAKRAWAWRVRGIRRSRLQPTARSSSDSKTASARSRRRIARSSVLRWARWMKCSISRAIRPADRSSRRSARSECPTAFGSARTPVEAGHAARRAQTSTSRTWTSHRLDRRGSTPAVTFAAHCPSCFVRTTVDARSSMARATFSVDTARFSSASTRCDRTSCTFARTSRRGERCCCEATTAAVRFANSRERFAR